MHDRQRTRCGAAGGCDTQGGVAGNVVGTGALLYAIKTEAVAVELHMITRCHTQVLAGAVQGHHQYTHHHYRQTAVRQVHAPHPARQSAQTGQPGSALLPALAHQSHRAHQQHPEHQRQDQGGTQLKAGAAGKAGRQPGGKGGRGRPEQRAAQLVKAALLPAGRKTQPQQGGCQQGQRHHEGVEKRRADRDLAQSQGINDQGVEGAQQYGGTGDGQQGGVGQQKHVFRQPGDIPAAADSGDPQGEQQQGATDHHHEEQQDKQPPGRIRGKGMHRCQHTRADQESAQQTQ